jgi:hypothetical protein
MNKKHIVAATVVALTIITAAAPAAQAAPYLSKVRARAQARQSVSHMVANSDDMVHYLVSSPSKCVRFAANRVACAYTIRFDSGVICSDAIYVRLSYDGYLTIRFPDEPNCS